MSLPPADRKWAQIMCKRQITEELWLENWSQMLPGATNYLYYSEMLVVEYVQKKVHSLHQTGLYDGLNMFRGSAFFFGGLLFGLGEQT